MVILYSTDWKKVPYLNKYGKNVIKIQITFLNEKGETVHVEKLYEEWMGVCTNNIRKTMQEIQKYFPGELVRYERYDTKLYKKVLPYFEERLQTGKFDYSEKPFYKLYTLSPIEDIGRFFDKRKCSFYRKEDWLIRISLDLCRDTIYYFRYQWYSVDTKEKWLLRALKVMPDKMTVPRWKIAAFDLETVTPHPNRVPTGSDPQDRVVMASIVTWYTDTPETAERYLLYLNPCQTERLGFIAPGYLECSSETQLINNFHHLISDCHILTGYNINNYDIPFLFARLMWLDMRYILKRYSSRMVGDSIITTFDNKLVLDFMNFIELQTQYDGPSMKLDVVAKHILDEGKDPLDPVGIHAWYATPVTKALCLSEEVEECRNFFRRTTERFGTFKKYLEYCLKDSNLVYRLFVKESVFGAMLMRANSVALDMVEAMHLGTSRIVLESFKTIGLHLGFFINVYHLVNKSDHTKFRSVFVDDKYQGALNFCIPNKYYTNVSNLDFTSMYPTVINGSNLCFGTFDMLHRDELCNIPKEFIVIAYRNHTDADFLNYSQTVPYPPFDPDRDEFGIVINPKTRGFLPTFVDFFMQRRKYHQKRYKETGNLMDHNAQGSTKLLVNSLYGTLGNKDSCLGYITGAMTVTALARYQLLEAYHYVQRRGYVVCYADTDSLMVQGWPVDDCDEINAYLNLPYVELKFENRMPCFLVLSKKRYVYMNQQGKPVTKGFQRRMNDLIQYMSKKITKNVMKLSGKKGSASDGWILWVKTLLKGEYKCRDPTKYYIHRKTKPMDEYKSKSCASMRYLLKYPEKSGQYIEFAYCRADVSEEVASKCIVDAKETAYVNFEKLFISQRKTYVSMLNLGYWQVKNPDELSSMVLNTMRWKKFVHAELLHYFKTGKRVCIFVEKGVKYTFRVNDHTMDLGKKKKTMKRKVAMKNVLLPPPKKRKTN